MADVTATETLTSRTSIGDQDLRQVSAPILDVRTSSGAVHAADVAGDDLVFETSVGDIEVTVVGVESDYRVEAASSVGDVNVPRGSAGADRRVRAHASTGAVSIAFVAEGASDAGDMAGDDVAGAAAGALGTGAGAGRGPAAPTAPSAPEAPSAPDAPAAPAAVARGWGRILGRFVARGCARVCGGRCGRACAGRRGAGARRSLRRGPGTPPDRDYYAHALRGRVPGSLTAALAPPRHKRLRMLPGQQSRGTVRPPCMREPSRARRPARRGAPLYSAASPCQTASSSRNAAP